MKDSPFHSQRDHSDLWDVAVHFRGRSIVFLGMDGFCEIPHFRLSEG
jgi:hypothetical protein